MRRCGRSVVGKTLWNLLEAAIRRGALYGNVRLLKQDEPIWNGKEYLGRPAIGVGEGLIAAYRRWVTQLTPMRQNDERAHHDGSFAVTSPVSAQTRPPGHMAGLRRVAGEADAMHAVADRSIQ